MQAVNELSDIDSDLYQDPGTKNYSIHGDNFGIWFNPVSNSGRNGAPVKKIKKMYFRRAASDEELIEETRAALNEYNAKTPLPWLRINTNIKDIDTWFNRLLNLTLNKYKG